MFISIKKGVFDKQQEEELNNSFKLIEDRIESHKATTIEESVQSGDINVENAKNNYSKYYGNIIFIMVQVNPQDTTTLKIQDTIAPQQVMYSRAFTMLDNDDKDKYFTAQLDTSGNITLTADTQYDVVFQFTYVLSKNPMIKS